MLSSGIALTQLVTRVVLEVHEHYKMKKAAELEPFHEIVRVATELIDWLVAAPTTNDMTPELIEEHTNRQIAIIYRIRYGK